ncbi:MAG: hypothetical protein XD40_2006 [Archaeoglobus fulgidus]|uniref:HTH arsR-type domain-containing protein n=1 Tax=Archaeoglobus fulgidus TaxID=2234 RepID=A0A101DYZ8_ARCFL|nr:ArsR family transcriptional regulator [Archaeoglobus fulgidus]KUJ92812.1 MAG: hypothetical protein XD40_2006 [Archaeoglobus fulgidus]KUK05524.1 MAG: hypothetical protein XD48_2242 [Archaeoglobus fulgidus]
MRAKLLLIFLLLTYPVSAFSDQPVNISDEKLQKILEEDDANEIRITFWDLPLWIKVQYILGVLGGLIAVWKLLPVVIAKFRSFLSSKRLQILNAVAENPGMSITELERALEMNRSTLRYYLRQLEGEGLVNTVRYGGSRCVFPSDAPFDFSFSLKGRKKDILDLLKENGGMTAKEIAGRLNLSVKTVLYHLSEMEELGIIIKDGKKYGLHCTDKI